MIASRLDPYARQSRLIWANRLRDWRQRWAEVAFHLVAGVAGAALLAYLLALQRDAVVAVFAWAAAAPAMLGLAVLVVLTLDQRALRRRELERARHDWLAAQPLPHALRRWRALRAPLLRAAAEGAALLLLAWFAHVPLALTLVALALLPVAALLAQTTPRPSIVPRESPFATRGRGSFWRWQWIEAGASLAPRRLAWALIAVLLVPRGPAAMVIVAVGLVALVAAATAWQRGLGVIPAAQRWIATQPVAPRRWLRACLAMPLSWLALVSTAVAVIAASSGPAWLALAAAMGLIALGTLQLAVMTSTRQHPARAPWLTALHALLLLSALQTLPPLAPALWILQLLWLTRRSLRA